MNDTLNPNLPFLSGSQMIEHAAVLDAVHTRTVKAIARLEKDVAQAKAAVANRWAGTNVSHAIRSQAEAEDSRVSLMNIRQGAEKELDGLMKEAGAAHSAIIAQRSFYTSPVLTLNRLTLGSAKRSEYARQVADAANAEVLHLGQYAVSTKNLELAAALVTRVEAMGVGKRPFNAVELATAMQVEEHRKGSEALRIAEVRLQAIVVAIRAWRADKANPTDAVALAMRKKEIDDEVLKEVSDAADALAR